jgi:primosomal protein N' (replication factor Y)
MSTLFGASAGPAPACARIAVERGVDRYPDGLTYLVPPELSPLAPGERVLVPLGRGSGLTPGYVIEVPCAGDLPEHRLKPVGRRDPSGARVPADLIDLARWVSAYTATPIGLTLAAMLPAAVRRNVGAVSRTYVELAPPPPQAPAASAPARVSSKQERVIEILRVRAAGGPMEVRALADAAGLSTTGPVRRLIETGRLRATHRSAIAAAWTVEPPPDDRRPDLTQEQARVVADVGAELDRGFSAHLLFGVTGSGKTEVYMRLIERVVRAGRRAILLVSEISLTPQTGGRILARFPDARIAFLHSGLTAAQRHQQWSLTATGGADIVVGARSAVFAPLPTGSLGLIVVDEEHDGSYKQDQAPRYHARDVAIRRAQVAAIPVLLGSATPSLESWHNATARGAYRLHRLRARAPGLTLPRVSVVDFAAQRRLRRDRRIHLLGPALEQALSRTLDGGAQALILLNRRGYASYIMCPDPGCSWVMQCESCDATMVHHLRPGALVEGGFVRCHHCQGERRLPRVCPQCQGRILSFGFGTQRVEQELAAKFPLLVSGRTLLRLDSDTMRSGRDYSDALHRFGQGAVRVLVGTQMIAKGLDYPGVRLVGVVNADTAIHLPDFRAAERTFQLVAQVAGRAGRGTGGGTVVVQSFQPDAPAVALGARGDFEAFAAGELAERVRLGLPPVTRMARLVVRDADAARARARAQSLAEGLRAEDGSVQVRGPAPCPMARLSGKFRVEILLVAPTAGPIQRLLAAARTRRLIEPGEGLAVDMDPMALL